MNRVKRFCRKFVIERTMESVKGTSNTCSADVTSMAEIVKRFNMNEAIPNSQLDMNYQYDENTLTYSTGENGGENTLNYEALNLVPMTENLDDVDLPEYDRIGEEMSTAVDRARAYMRGKQLEVKASKDAQEKAEYERLKKTFGDGVVEQNVSAPTPVVPKSSENVTKV